MLPCFLVQVATGFAMTFYYRRTVTMAFASVQYIMIEANFGWLIRSVHRWSASMTVLMIILHVFCVYLIGGFKKPCKLTWAIVRGSSGRNDHIFWCNRLFFTLGPNWVSGSQNYNGRTEKRFW
ncbi:hypothetical protein Pint_33165 [Pistacia integerrima]|uniref:Uncharacterized protein n=1 Tax=Pistacia integerrima TaxID=434235 RepID=A0ACC0X3I9_9ROSI|nr:hypothetical protein Pint_33165 [Pistacia integerrima]